MWLTPIEMEAVQISLQVAVWAMVWSLPVGIAAAWLLARREFLGKAVLDALIHLPLVVPPVVVGYTLLVLFGRHGVIGAWLHEAFGVTIAFTWKGAAVAAAVMAFPLMVRSIRLSFEAVDQRLEAAARTLGASPLDAFFTVTLPLTAPGILAGTILGFARSLGEFGATITFVSNIPGETRTLPIALYGFTQTPDGEAAAMRLVVIAVILAFVALGVSEFLARRVRARLRRDP